MATSVINHKYNLNDYTLFIYAYHIGYNYSMYRMSQKVSIQHATGFGLLNAHRFQSFLYEYEFRLNYAFSNSSSVSLNLRPDIGLGINNDYRSATFKDSIYKQPFYNDLVDVPVGYKALLS